MFITVHTNRSFPVDLCRKPSVPVRGCHFHRPRRPAVPDAHSGTHHKVTTCIIFASKVGDKEVCQRNIQAATMRTVDTTSKTTQDRMHLALSHHLQGRTTSLITASQEGWPGCFPWSTANLVRIFFFPSFYAKKLWAEDFAAVPYGGQP